GCDRRTGAVVPAVAAARPDGRAIAGLAGLDELVAARGDVTPATRRLATRHAVAHRRPARLHPALRPLSRAGAARLRRSRASTGGERRLLLPSERLQALLALGPARVADARTRDRRSVRRYGDENDRDERDDGEADGRHGTVVLASTERCPVRNAHAAARTCR